MNLISLYIIIEMIEISEILQVEVLICTCSHKFSNVLIYVKCSRKFSNAKKLSRFKILLKFLETIDQAYMLL